MFSFITDGNFIVFRFTETDVLRSEHDRYRLHNTSKCIDWALPEDTTRITFTIDEGRYENIPLSSIDFDGDVCEVQQDFIDGVQGMFENLAPGEGGSSYLVYTGTLSQESTNAPVSTVLENTLGGTLVWAYGSQGYYTGTLAGAFTDATKVQIFMGAGGYGSIFEGGQVSADSIGITVLDAAGAPQNDKLYNTPIEIRVYP